MKDPRDFNDAFFLDALLYGIAVDSLSQSATVTLEVDTTYHEGVLKLLPGLGKGDVFIDVVMSGVQSVRVDGIPQRNASWAADEKPHDWEIAVWKVRAVPFRAHGYTLNIRCQLGQTLRVAFGAMTARASDRERAAVHTYA